MSMMMYIPKSSENKKGTIKLVTGPLENKVSIIKSITHELIIMANPPLIVVKSSYVFQA